MTPRLQGSRKELFRTQTLAGLTFAGRREQRDSSVEPLNNMNGTGVEDFAGAGDAASSSWENCLTGTMHWFSTALGIPERSVPVQSVARRADGREMAIDFVGGPAEIACRETVAC